MNIACSYDIIARSETPLWLPCWVKVEARLIGSAPVTSDVDSQAKTTLLVPGVKGWDEASGISTFELTPPRPGRFSVYFVVTVTDIFGRSILVAFDRCSLDAE